MYRIRLHWEGEVREIGFDPGPSLRDILNTSEFRTRSACRGNGACGLCRVRVGKGSVEPPSRVEELHLEPEELRRGVRLACRIVPAGDMDIELLNPAPPSVWRSLADPPCQSDFPPDDSAAETGHYAVAVDLGTTHISVALCDPGSGRQLAMRYGPNPQGSYSADILNRLMAAGESAEQAADLQRGVLEAVAEALMDISVREGRSLYEVSRVRLVGNSAMLALLASDHVELLLDPASWSLPFSCHARDTGGWKSIWNLPPEADVDLIQPLAGFIGSDLAAGLVHTRLTARVPPVLFIDVGTNSEIALWDGERILVTSAAGGPAFEGAGIACGMAADTGAIARVGGNGEGLRYEVLGHVEPRGICGSGLIDLTAVLLRQGLVTPLGRLDAAPDGRFHLPGTRLWITKNDLDMLQRAKAAIAVGCRELMRQAGLAPSGLREILVAGAFGRYLDPPNAMALGLLPRLPADRVRLLGNTALRGCQDLLISAEARAALSDLRYGIEVINLAAAEHFQELFLEHLYLRPQAEGFEWERP